VTGTAMLPTGSDDAVRIPVGRLGTTDETADLAVTMLANGYLTGKTYLLDGGIYPR
jgi:NAD(P)-dependent dehydrogenase (short-subunit alcohol dehydrogenase family)